MNRRSLTVLASIIILPLLLGGCVRLPDSGSPRRVVDDGAVDSSVGYVVNATGPSDGASPAEIINGFILASADTRGGHSVAREFLTDSLAASWQPDAQVQVLSSMPDLDAREANHIVATGGLQAVVDAAGVYHEQAASLRQEYSLTQVNGQWRISGAPDGVLMTRASFDLVFRSTRLAYLSASRDILVPDVRWFQVGDQTATRVVKAFLAGPVPAVQAAVQPLVANDLHLAVDAVGVSNGVASISLSAEFLSLDEQRQRQIKTLLVRSLNQIGDIHEVNLSANNLRIDLQTIPTAELDFAHTTDNTVLTVGDEVQVMDAQSWQKVSPLPADLQPVQAALSGRRVTGVSVRRDAFAASAAEGMLYMGSDHEVRLLNGAVQGTASLDALETAWAVSDNQVHWVDVEDGRSGVLTTAGTVVGAAIAPEGARLALAVTDGDVTSLQVFGVQRDAEGYPSGLSGMTDLGTVPGSLTALTWNGDDQVAAAVSQSSEDHGSTVFVRPLSGAGSQTGLVGRVTQLSGGEQDTSLRAVCDGSLFSLQDGTATGLGLNVSALSAIWA